MQGYVLPLALAVLLAAPAVWRLGSDVGESPAVQAENTTPTAAQPLSLTSLDPPPSASAEHGSARIEFHAPTGALARSDLEPALAPVGDNGER